MRNNHLNTAETLDKINALLREIRGKDLAENIDGANKSRLKRELKQVLNQCVRLYRAAAYAALQPVAMNGTGVLDPSMLRFVVKQVLDVLDNIDTGNIVKGVAADTEWRRLGNEIHRVNLKLSEVEEAINPIKQPLAFLDVSEPAFIGKAVADNFLKQPPISLDTVPQFYGSGVYALYYVGDFDAYAPIKNTDTPIYVGKADPKSTGAKHPTAQGDTLWRRLQEHKRTIADPNVTNLAIEEFQCRYLAVSSTWHLAAEVALINQFKPIWNKEINVCVGFSKHGDREARNNKRSRWDTLHPERDWTTGHPPNDLSAQEIKEKIADHFRQYPPEPVVQEVTQVPPDEHVRIEQDILTPED